MSSHVYSLRGGARNNRARKSLFGDCETRCPAFREGLLHAAGNDNPLHGEAFEPLVPGACYDSELVPSMHDDEHRAVHPASYR